MLCVDCVYNVGYSTPHNSMGLHCLLRGYLYFVYADDICTSQKIHLCASTSCYGDSFTSPGIYDVRTSQNTHLCVSMLCHGDSFTFLYLDYICTSQEAHLCTAKICYGYIRFEVFTVVTMKNAVLWDVTPCGHMT
jgi:hypothetical protein